MDKQAMQQYVIHVAGAPLTLIPHCVEGTGARVFVVLDVSGADRARAESYTPDDLRFLAAQIKLAADEAECLERTMQRRRA